MCTKMMYNITVFKNVFQNQMAKFHTATLQLLLHQLNMNNTKKTWENIFPVFETIIWFSKEVVHIMGNWMSEILTYICVHVPFSH